MVPVEDEKKIGESVNPVFESLAGWWFQHVSTIMKNMSSSMGSMTCLFYDMENKIHV